MARFFENSDYYYNHDRSYYIDRRASSEWSNSPSASTPMTREPSGESAITTYSSSSEYELYDSLWPSMPIDNQDTIWPPMSDRSHDITFPLTNASLANVPDTSEYTNEDAWWLYYDFITDVEPAYWRLKEGFQATDQRPATRLAEDISTVVPRSPTNEGMFICLAKGCTKSFRRKADLERHYCQLHVAAEEKAKFPCDWKKCQRNKDPFHRRDHQRDHYRDYHHEDLVRRGSSGREDRNWWSTRKINPDWWRCARCLGRVKVEEYGYACPMCRMGCETERQYYRTH
ncbi:hypothetical protein F5X98DRAFT_14758 [Xylaria grammica]|nr:hypothetical protein F5X98DRAFT_14758 [Xylaria grammica]